MDMLVTSSAPVVQQHLIDPEICIRCNTCEAICPVGAITHDSRNYVVNAEICNGCQACVPPCPTGSIDNWRDVPRGKVFPIAEQLLWDELPDEISADELAAASSGATGQGASGGQSASGLQAAAPAAPAVPAIPLVVNHGSTTPPWSAAKPYANLYTPKKTVTAKVTGNHRVTALGTSSDTHHVVLDFGTEFFPALEGQSLGIIPPGLDDNGKTHHPRQYSIASARDGERKGYNNLSLTVKRVLEDHDGKPVVGVASNYVCDLKVGDTVQVTGPFGTSFLMPNHPGSNIVMICTGTGSAPMRAMTEFRRRALETTDASKYAASKLMLFFGARTKEELPYFGPLLKLPKDFIDISFVFSRDPELKGKKRYVQDAMLDKAGDLSKLMQDDNTYFYVCGLKSMEHGVLQSMETIAKEAGMDWAAIKEQMRVQGRLHLETY
jgi:benzoyl-CoA 2,3-epoxidase subunit A